MSKSVRTFLNEDTKAIVVTFGRFQPPTIGHKKLIDAVVGVARKERAEHRIYPSRSNDKKKNPLQPKDKVRFMKKMFKGANIIDDDSIKNPFAMMKQLSDEGYKKVILVVGGDRVSAFDKQIRPYIGHKDPKKRYDFDEFKVVSAGERDPDAEGVEGMSASKMRAAVEAGDFESFQGGVGNKAVAKQLYNALKKAMGIRESLQVDWSMLTLLEEKTSTPTLVALTKSSSSDEKSDTIVRIEEACEKRGVTFFPIHTDHAFVVDKDLDDNELVVHNYNGEGKNIRLTTDNTICLVRGGALVDNAGMALVKIFQESGMFTVNDLEAMKFCQNKLSTALALEQNQISSPRTAFVNNEDSIDIALDKIGGQFPVIVKTITGAEGIGVMKIDSQESLKSVLQTLWKQDTEVIIQEYIEIKYDVRTLVLDGKIVASVKRIKGGKDFRTNKALGNDSEPYKLSKAERDLVIQAYKMSGCYFAGVDHITNKGTHYILEVNGSPGSGAAPYHGYEPDRKLSSGALIRILLDHILNKENWKYTAKEIGFVEYITIDGVGKLKAKIDTGNGTVNAIGATDIKKEGKSVSFKILGKKFTKPIIQTQNINIGSGVEEDRYIVEFDVKFGRKEYKNIRFNLADRNENNYLVLVGKSFLEKLNYSVNVAKTFTLGEEKKPLLEAVDVNFGFELLDINIMEK